MLRLLQGVYSALVCSLRSPVSNLSSSYKNIFSRIYDCTVGGFVALLLFSVSTHAATTQSEPSDRLDLANFDIYYGDLNNDGTDGDIYFHQKDYFVLIASEISIPLMVESEYGFVAYRSDSPAGYSAASGLRLTRTELAALQKAALNLDYFQEDSNNDGEPDIFIHGASPGFPALIVEQTDIGYPDLVVRQENDYIDGQTGIECDPYSGSAWLDLPATSNSNQFSVCWSGNALGAYQGRYALLREQVGGSWNTVASLNAGEVDRQDFVRADGTYTFGIQDCKISAGQSGSSTDCDFVIIKSIVVDAPEPVVTAVFDTSSIGEGGSATFSWRASGASSCSAVGIAGVSGLSGSVIYSAPQDVTSAFTQTVTVTCSGSGGSASKSVNLSVMPVNDAPTISSIPEINTIINANESTSVQFTVSDIDNENGALVLSAISSTNSALLPTANVYFGGSGSNRTVWVTPVAGQTGTATITLRVSDGSLTTSSLLAVNVGGAPTVPVFSGDPLATITDPANDTLSGSEYYGGVKGAYSVGNDGSFNYDIPFVIPVGVQGMSPSVGVSYNSGAGNGVVGWGFNLNGFSYIHRCTANFKRDGRASGINDGDDYRYCLNGSRLVHIGGNEYRTESESYLHITKYADYWEVEDQGGSVARFGYNTDAKEFSANETHTWKQDRQEDTFGNYLTIEYEAGALNGADYGRPLKISYTQNANLANMPMREVVFAYEDRPDIISGYKAGRAYIENKRLSSVTVKNNGAELWTYSLSYVDENPGKTDLDDPVARSLLDTVQRCFYGSGCEKALTIDWTQRKASDYIYSSMETDFQARRAEIVSEFSPASVDLYIDIDGDGIEEGFVGPEDTETVDYFYENDYSSPQTITPQSEYTEVDVNGDGYKDVVRFNPTTVGVQVYLNESDGAGGRRISSTSNENYSLDSDSVSFYGARALVVMEWTWYAPDAVWIRTGTGGVRESGYGYDMQFVDINQDGLIDLVRTPPACPPAAVGCGFVGEDYAKDISVVLNTGTAWEKVGSDPNFSTLYDQWDNEKQFTSIQFIDLNADGHLDIFASGEKRSNDNGHQKKRYALYNNGADNVSQMQLTEGNVYGKYIGDFNGDGHVDFVDIVNGEPSIAAGNGGGFDGQAIANVDPVVVNSETFSSTTLVIDFNNDGLDDIVELTEVYDPDSALYTSTQTVRLSNGADANGVFQFSDPITFRSGSYGNSQMSGITAFTDYNNDGLLENSPSLKVGFEELRIENIYSEAQDLTVNYESFDMTSVVLSGSGVQWDGHAKDFFAEHDIYLPKRQLKQSSTRFGVESLEVSDGIGGFNTISYNYEGAKFDTASYGHLGFEKIESTEQISGESGYVRTESHYHQIGNEDYQLSRVLKHRSTYASENGSTEVKISESRYQWKVKLFDDDIDSHPSPHYYSYVSEETAESFDLNGDAVGTSVTRNYETSDYSCNMLTLSETETVSTYVAGSWEDSDFNSEGVQLNSASVTCDASSSDADAPEEMTQIVAMQNADIINKGARRGLVQTSRNASWFGPSVSVPSGNLWSQAVNGVSATASCSVVEAQTAPWQAETIYTFDADGLMQTKTVKPGAGAGKEVVSTFDYNTSGSLKTVTDTWTNASGDLSLNYSSRTTSTLESFNGNRQRVIVTSSALGSSTAIYHSVFDTPVSQTDVNQLITQTTYDQLGRVVFVDSPTAIDTQIDYRTCNNCFSESSFAQSYTQSKTTGAAASRSYFDRLGRAVGSRTRGFDGSYIYSNVTYGKRGLVMASAAPYYDGETQHITQTAYDVLNRPTVVTRPDNATTSFVYAGLKKQIVNVNNQVQTRYASASGNVLRNFDNAGTPVDFTYWPNGSIKTTEVGGGNNPETQVCIGFDDMGRKNFLDDPNTGRTTYSYNALGLLSTQTDAKGQVTRFEYDNIGRVINQHDDANGADRVQSWSYDGQLLGLADGLSGENTDGTSYQETYTYDAFGRPTNTNATYQGKSFSSGVAYDSYGRPLSSTYPGGYQVASVYNNWGQVEKIVETGDKQILWQLDEANALGQVTEASLGDNSLVARVYTPETGLLESVNTIRENQTVQDQYFTFDSLGNLTSRTDYIANQTQAFCYDDLNRLVAARSDSCSAQDADFTYDDLGNIKTKTGVSGTYAYGNNAGPHAVTSANGLSYSYDANGNLTESRTGTNQVVRDITYSSFNKPIIMEKGAWASHIVYGANHNRIKRTDYEGVNVKRMTYYFGGYEETIEDNGPTRRVYTIGDFAQRVEIVDTGESYHEFLHKDHIGSVVAKTTDRDYNIDRSAFDPWGTRLEDTWNSNPTGPEYTDTSTRGFTGHEHLDPVGLIHMNGRVYDPELGRFLSPDPFVQAPFNTQNYNRYSYVWNNPLSMVDPSGYFCRGGSSSWDNYVKGNADKASAFNTRMTSAIDGLTDMKKLFKAGFTLKDLSDSSSFQRKKDILKLVQWLRNNRDHPMSVKVAAAIVNTMSLQAIDAALTPTPSGGGNASPYALLLWIPVPAADAQSIAVGIVQEATSVLPNAQQKPLAKGKWRALTTDEIELAKSVFGDSIDYSDVRIYNKKYFLFQPKNVAMAPNGNIYFHPEGGLYSDNFADTNLKGLFIHEMTHVWQHQQGVNVAMRAMFNRTYEYTLTPGMPLTSYGIEQQGDFVRDYYRLQHDSAGGPLIELYREAIPFAQ